MKIKCTLGFPIIMVFHKVSAITGKISLMKLSVRKSKRTLWSCIQKKIGTIGEAIWVKDGVLWFSAQQMVEKWKGPEIFLRKIINEKQNYIF